MWGNLLSPGLQCNSSLYGLGLESGHSGCWCLALSAAIQPFLVYSSVNSLSDIFHFLREFSAAGSRFSALSRFSDILLSSSSDSLLLTKLGLLTLKNWPFDWLLSKSANGATKIAAFSLLSDWLLSNQAKGPIWQFYFSYFSSNWLALQTLHDCPAF